VRKLTDGRMAIGALAAFAFWIFVALPLYYGPRDDSAAHKCSAQEEKNYGFWEKARCDPVAYFTAWLVGFTGVLAVSTIGLWVVTWQSGKRQSRDMEAAVGETRRIGEAQVRAYVDIVSADIFLIGFAGALYRGRPEAQPILKIVATNTGQSPARNFVWNPVLEYTSVGTGSHLNRIRELGRNWRDILGVGIAVGQAHTDSAMVGEMALVRFLQETGNADATTILTRVRIEFEFEDVFGDRIAGDAYFSGLVNRAPQPIATEFGQALWMGKLTRMHRPRDWPAIGNNQQA
jgi:hypothetical protein